MGRTKEEEEEFLARTEAEVREGMIYLIHEGHDDAINRILDACKTETNALKYGLGIAAMEIKEVREKLLKVIEESASYDQND